MNSVLSYDFFFTAHEELVDRLIAIPKLQVGSNEYNFVPYLKPLPNTSAEVVVGITDWLTNDNIMEYIGAPRHEIVSARRLGNSSAALLHFKEPHVPFYVKVLGTNHSMSSIPQVSAVL